MYATSAAFRNAIINGGTPIAKASVSVQGVPIEGGEDLPIVGGSINVDRQAQVRRRASLAIAVNDSKWIPEKTADLLFPSGAEVSVQAGFRFPTGDELIPQGVFRISKPTVNVSGDGQVSLRMDCYDRSRAVRRDRFRIPWIVPKGAFFEDAIGDIIERTFPWIDRSDYRMSHPGWTTGQLMFNAENDPLVSIAAMAASIGHEFLFDVDGMPTLQPIPNYSLQDVCWEYLQNEQATLTEINKDLDDETAYNGCIVTGMNSSNGVPPVRAEAWDTDMNSPTWYDPQNPENSSYGAVPFFMRSEYVTTVDQAQLAADTNLQKKLGILKQISFSAVPNPAHDGGDVVRIVNTQSKVSGIHILEAFNFDLGLGALMTGITRERRITQ